MILPCPQTMVLLACVCSAIGTIPMSVYNKKLELLSSVFKYDYLWRHILLEKVYYNLDRTYYKDIIENELLVNAQNEPPVTGESKKDVTHVKDTSKTDTRDEIVPYTFIRNILSMRRFVVGSILDMGLGVLQVSYKCLIYKHLVHLSYLIRVEMGRNDSQRKAGSWSGKSKLFIESILMTIGALQFTDMHLLSTLSFFDIYKAKSNSISKVVRTQYAQQLNDRIKLMLEYVKKNCVEQPTFSDNVNLSPEKEIATMLGFEINPKLYITSTSFKIPNEEFKGMILNSQKKIKDVFGSSPRINGMPMTLWYDILHYQENLEMNKDE